MTPFLRTQADHLLQKKKIFYTYGSKHILLFSKRNKFYTWDQATINDNELTYNKSSKKQLLSIYNPDMDENTFLTKIESNIQNVVSLPNLLTASQVNRRIINGLSEIARYPAMRVLTNYGHNINGYDFNTILISLICESPLLIKNDTDEPLNVLQDIIIYNDALKFKFENKLLINTIVYDTYDLLLSDHPLLYYGALMVYPISFNTLLMFRRTDLLSEKLQQFLTICKITLLYGII